MQNGVGKSLTGETVFSYERYGSLEETCSTNGGNSTQFLAILYQATDLRTDMTLENGRDTQFEQAGWKKERGSWEQLPMRELFGWHHVWPCEIDSVS